MPDLAAFARAVRLRDRAVAAAVAHHERAGLRPSQHYARATYDAIEQLIREDERARLGLVDDDPRHIIEFRTDGWTIKHPLSCRVGDLFGCAVNLAAEDLDGPPVPPGRYVTAVDGIDGRLRIGDRVTPAEG